MSKQVIIILSIALTIHGSFAQSTTNKDKAIDEFKKEHYDEAIRYLEKAAEEFPSDAEIYYYLGFFNHYRAYDSRPMIGYDFSYSESIFKYLEKALELNPNFGNAKYFYGAECSGNAFRAMQDSILKQLKYFYQLAYQKGAYPDWLQEYGKNMLKSCEKNAILFAGGNADFDVCLFLQLEQNIRTDITIIPIGNIDRPWYVKFLKQGLENGIRAINLNLSDKQIYDIHPYKWDTTNLTIQVSHIQLNKFKLNDKFEMQWVLEPDLISFRKPSKIEGEKIKNRTYLSPQRAILLQIIEDNFSARPIYFSTLVDVSFTGGLNAYFQNCGLVSELLPFKTNLSEYEINFRKLKQLLKNSNLKDYSSIVTNDIPRISGMVNNYYQAFLNLAKYYKNNNNTEKLNELRVLFKKRMIVGFNVNLEHRIEYELEHFNK